MSIRAQFPGTEMCRHENHASPPAQTFEIILESVVNDVSMNVGFVQFRKVRKFDQQPCEVLKTFFENLFSFDLVQVRKCHAKIAQAGIALPAGQVQSEPSQSFSGAMRHAARHGPE